MPSVTAIRGMLRTDTLRLRRDRFMIGLSVILLANTLVMRWLLPVITKEASSEWETDLTAYHPVLVSYFVIQLGPMLPGIIGGFLLLESREDDTVKALLVCPNPLTSYVSIVCVVMFLTGVILTVTEGAIIALALPPWPALIAVGLAAGMWAPVFALLVAALADNKVQAFAYMKVLGLGPLLATVAYFISEPWQWFAAIYPPYCASKAFWLAEAGGSEWPLWVLGGLVSTAVWVVVMQRVFMNAARR